MVDGKAMAQMDAFPKSPLRGGGVEETHHLLMIRFLQRIIVMDQSSRSRPDDTRQQETGSMLWLQLFHCCGVLLLSFVSST
jgi:hypothetical protein